VGHFDGRRERVVSSTGWGGARSDGILRGSSKGSLRVCSKGLSKSPSFVETVWLRQFPLLSGQASEFPRWQLHDARRATRATRDARDATRSCSFVGVMILLGFLWGCFLAAAERTYAHMRARPQRDSTPEPSDLESVVLPLRHAAYDGNLIQFAEPFVIDVIVERRCAMPCDDVPARAVRGRGAQARAGGRPAGVQERKSAIRQ
jgi:hypothetical protein